MSFEAPRPGEQVKLWGLQHRPELNGFAAEVLDVNSDTGLVTVSVNCPGAGGDTTMRKRMRVQPSRLLSVPATPSPGLGRSMSDMSFSGFSGGLRGDVPSSPGTRSHDSSRAPLVAGMNIAQRPVTGRSIETATTRASTRSTSLSSVPGYTFDRAAYKAERDRLKTLAHLNNLEYGTVSISGKLKTDVTEFAKYFMEATGMPIHKGGRESNPDFVLRDPKTRQPVPKWQPP